MTDCDRQPCPVASQGLFADRRLRGTGEFNFRNGFRGSCELPAEGLYEGFAALANRPSVPRPKRDGRSAPTGNLRLTRARSAKLRRALDCPGLPNAPTATCQPPGRRPGAPAGGPAGEQLPPTGNGRLPADGLPASAAIPPPRELGRGQDPSLGARWPGSAPRTGRPPFPDSAPGRESVGEAAFPRRNGRSRYTTGTREQTPASAAWRAARAIKGCPNGGRPRPRSLPPRR